MTALGSLLPHPQLKIGLGWRLCLEQSQPPNGMATPPQRNSHTGVCLNRLGGLLLVAPPAFACRLGAACANVLGWMPRPAMLSIFRTRAWRRQLI